MSSFFDTVTQKTEKFLTWRKRRKLKQKAKSKQKNIILDWIEAFFWSAGMVLLVNQYLLQAFVIPSGSMEDTLKIEDRIFVNKLVYGPELLPNLVKLPGLDVPERGDIIIFESPEYIGQGPVYDILKRMIYMVTLSFVDIDQEFFYNQQTQTRGWQPKAQFLIKRAAGFERDQVRFMGGQMQIRGFGDRGAQWTNEVNLAENLAINSNTRKLLDGLGPSSDEALSFYYQALEKYFSDRSLAGYPNWGDGAGISQNIFTDNQGNPLPSPMVSRLGIRAGHDHPEMSFLDYGYQLMADPALRDASRWIAFAEEGLYIPEGFLLPLGDNRDNSRDGRRFGPVSIDKILGTPAFRYFPLDRLGGMQ